MITTERSVSTTPIRVLIVDDSATMRSLIRAALSGDPAITVVGEAEDAPTARDLINKHKPDVVTLDVELPGMNGLEFLARIMRFRPMPVIMVSSFTQKGADVSVEALALGAFDCIGKPSFGSDKAPFAALADLVRTAAQSNTQARKQPHVDTPAPSPKVFRANNKIVAMGASTGGVEALAKILSRFPENCPPTLITQHMPSGFTRSFALRLNANCAPNVQEAEDGAPIKPGHVYLAPGGDHHLEVTLSPDPRCALVAGAKVSGHRPSVDRLFSSFAALKSRAVGVILTGMGKDGAAGLLQMRRAGAMTIGQDESTSVVYGMPREAASVGAVTQQLSVHHIATGLLNHCSGGGRGDQT